MEVLKELKSAKIKDFIFNDKELESLYQLYNK
jgi:hypothetical protein